MFKYLTFTKQAGTGSQTVTGVGFQGKALLIWSTRQTSAGATDGAQLTVGMTDGVRQMTRFIKHPDNQANTTSAQAEQTDHLVYQTSATNGIPVTVENAATFTAFTSDGFRLNWITNDGAADIYHAVVFGGAIQVEYVPVKITVNTGGTIAVTGLGFQPESFIVVGGAADEFGTGDYANGAPYGSIHGFGFSNAVDDVCGWTVGFGTNGAAVAYKGQHADRCASIRVANVAGYRDTELCGIQITATSGDGFTVTRSGGSITHQPVQHILAIRGVQSALGSFSTPGSPSIHTISLPFQPELLLLQTHGVSATTANGMSLAMGAWDPTSSGSVWIGGTDGSNPSIYARASVTGKVLESRAEAATGSSSSITIDATVDAVSPTGADIDFTTVPVSAATVLYMAFAASGALIDGGCVGGGAIAVVPDPRAGETFTGRVLEPRAWVTLGFDDENRSFALDSYNHVPTYYGGRKRGCVVSFGAIRRQLSYPRGSYRLADATVDVDDTSRLFASLEDDAVSARWWNREGRIYLASKDTIAQEETPHTLFRGIWRGHRTNGLTSRTLELQDLFGSDFSLFNLEQPIPQRLITAADFPDAPPDVLGRVVPIIYGVYRSTVRSGAITMTLRGVPGGYYPFGVGLDGPEVGYVATVNGNGIERNILYAADVRGFDVLPGTTPTSVVVSSGGAGSLPQTRNNTWTAMVTAIHDGVESDPAPVAAIALGTDSAVDVSWTAASGGANGGYRIYLADNPYGVSTKFSTFAAPFFVGSEHVYVYAVGSGTTSINITAPGDVYTWDRIHLYQVSAVFSDGDESAPGGVVIGMSHPYNRPPRLRWLPFSDGSPSTVDHYVVRRAPYVGIDQAPAFDRQFTVATTSTETVDGVTQVVWSDTFNDGDAAVVGQITPPDGGPIPVIYVGTRDINGIIWGRLLIAGHALTHIEEVYVGGVPAPVDAYGTGLLVAGFGGSPDGDAYEDINGNRYACIYAKDTYLSGHLDGSAPITLALCAIEENGDGSGLTITRAPRVIAHLLEQWAVLRNGETYRSGGWATPAVGDDGVPWLNTVSFDALEAIEIARLSAYRTAVSEASEAADAEGYELNLYLAEPVTVRQILESVLTPCTDIYFGQNPFGQLVGVHPPDSYTPADVVHLTDVAEIIDLTATEQRIDEMETTRVYHYDYRPASGEFRHSDEGIRNQTALSANLSRDVRSERVPLYGVAKEAQARDIARRSVTRTGRPPRWARLVCSLHALRVTIGSVIVVDDVDGTGADGWVQRPLWVVGITVLVNDLDAPPVVHLDCLDAVWLTDAAPSLSLVVVPTPRGSGGFTTGSSPSASWAGALGDIESGITELTGDVTAGPGSGTQAATIANGAVTFAKIVNIATDRILGRDTAGSGVIEELTVGNGLEFSGSGGLQQTDTARIRTIGITIGDGTNVITTGVKEAIQIPFSCTILEWTILAVDAAITSGSIVIDLWKDTYANFPPTVADTITASAKPTVTSATKATSSTLTGWTTAITAGDILRFNVDSATTMRKVILTLKVRV